MHAEFDDVIADALCAGGYDDVSILGYTVDDRSDAQEVFTECVPNVEVNEEMVDKLLVLAARARGAADRAAKRIANTTGMQVYEAMLDRQVAEEPAWFVPPRASTAVPVVSGSRGARAGPDEGGAHARAEEE